VITYTDKSTDKTKDQKHPFDYPNSESRGLRHDLDKHTNVTLNSAGSPDLDNKTENPSTQTASGSSHWHDITSEISFILDWHKNKH
jgi:hypothetical protein